MRAIFFGTPAIAVPSLVALSEVAELVGVVSQPDRPAGRGLRLQASAVKLAALERGLEVYQPTKVRSGELTAWLRERAPDLALVIAYGRILPGDVLAVPRLGCLNLHASLLPRYRGAAPIQWAIIRGETETGISLMQMDEGLDSGPVFSRHTLPIAAAETYGELAERLALLAGDVVRSDLPRVAAGTLASEAQEHALATRAPPILKDDCRIDWSQSARDILNLVRGLAPRPSAFSKLGEKQLRITRGALSPGPFELAPGVVGTDGGRVWVGTGGELFELLAGQVEGKRELAARDLVNGRVLSSGQVLG
ncbi:MAG TPA: methionyl-tRNA formyltransferase [Polyangiaceae bacterium]|nr:methionyl-tRNA formyltransferase [Polyangiaceae bacterium]